jgi:hypothetical protein
MKYKMENLKVKKSYRLENLYLIFYYKYIDFDTINLSLERVHFLLFKMLKYLHLYFLNLIVSKKLSLREYNEDSFYFMQLAL